MRPITMPPRPLLVAEPQRVQEPSFSLEMGAYRARLAMTQAEREMAYRLRFLVFNLELQEGLESAFVTGMDTDVFDAVCDHLLVEEKATGAVVGTYREDLRRAGDGSGVQDDRLFDVAGPAPPAPAGGGAVSVTVMEAFAASGGCEVDAVESAPVRLWGVLRTVWVVVLLIVIRLDTLRVRRRGAVERAVWMHRWCGRLVWTLGLRLRVEGEVAQRGAIVCNHMTYMETVLLQAVRPMILVAKREVSTWPMLGAITRVAGTVYVVRGGGRSTWRTVNGAMREAYATGLPVVFFPEGTTTEGREVLPFRRGLFHSILNEDVPVQAAALLYTMPAEGNAGCSVERDVCWLGEATFGPHLLRFLGLRGVEMTVRFGPVVRERTNRFALSEAARREVACLLSALREGAGCEQEVAAATVNEAVLAK